MKLTAEYINNLSTRVYEQNKEVGWWDDPDRCIFECLQLVSTEVAEATEGARKNLMDDKLTHRCMEEVELADAFIRVVDIGGKYGLVFDHRYYAHENFKGAVIKPVSNWSVGRMHWSINIRAVHFSYDFWAVESYDSDVTHPNEQNYSLLLSTIIEVAALRGYDLHGAIEEKLAFNKTRPDHQRENRAAGNGPSF